MMRIKSFNEFINESKVNELSTDLISHASDKAAEKGKYDQAIRLADEALERMWKEAHEKMMAAEKKHRELWIKRSDYQFSQAKKKRAEEAQRAKEEIENTKVFTPKSREELIKIIANFFVAYEGSDEVIDLNKIDTSKVTDMNYLFNDAYFTSKVRKAPKIDISK